MDYHKNFGQNLYYIQQDSIHIFVFVFLFVFHVSECWSLFMGKSLHDKLRDIVIFSFTTCSFMVVISIF